jgi:hypothetical protein
METWTVQAKKENIAAQTARHMQENFLKEKQTANANAYCMRSKHNNRKKEILCKQKKKKRCIFCREKYEKVQGYDYYIFVPYICCCYAGWWVAVAVAGAASPTHTRTEIQPPSTGLLFRDGGPNSETGVQIQRRGSKLPWSVIFVCLRGADTIASDLSLSALDLWNKLLGF